MRVLVSGYYGFGNLGDEALLTVLIEVLQDRFGLSGDAICVLSATPTDTSQRHGIGTIPRTSLWAFRRELTRSDLFISGGGGLIQDETSRRSAGYYLGLLHWAQRHMPVVIMGQGLGPLNSGLTQRWAYRTLPNARAALVRDEASVRLLRRWDMPADRLFRSADLTFLRWRTSPNGDRASGSGREPAFAEPPNADHAPYMLVALRGDHADASRSRLRDSLQELADHCGIRPAFMAMHRHEDRAPLERLAGELSFAPPVLDPANVETLETLRCFRGAEMVIGSRLHALIFAMLVRRPFLALGTDHKLTHLLRDVADVGGPDIPQLPLAGQPARPIKLASAIEGVSPWNDRWEAAGAALADRTHQAVDGFLHRLEAIVSEASS